MWTYDDWSLVLERWVEKPPDDYLQLLPIWVRIHNILVCCYDAAQIEEMSESLGQVLEVAFDPMKPLSKCYVRVRILFDVSRLLRNVKYFETQSGRCVYGGFRVREDSKEVFSMPMSHS